MMFIYGPVRSRRLGSSLGVDVIPYKTCSFDCIYCQLGKTTNKTIEIKEWTKEKTLLNALESRLSQFLMPNPQSPIPNYITFSGSGEPTLNSKLGSLIKKVKQITPIPVAVLTNSSLLYQEKIRENLMSADLVLPSFSTATQTLFEKVNRPHPSITLDLMIEGLKAFCKEYKGLIWLEIMLIKNINDSPDHIRNLNSIVGTNSIRAKLDKIHLNTVVRPPAEKFACPLNSTELQNVARGFSAEGGSASGGSLAFSPSQAEVEVIAESIVGARHAVPPTVIASPPTVIASDSEAISYHFKQKIFELIKRRPVTPEELSISLALPLDEVLKYITLLEQEGKIKKEIHRDTFFYK